MALIPGICTQCGATLSVDTTKDCMICPYCGKPFIVDKAIQTFNRKYGDSASAGNGYGTKTSDFVIRAGVLEKYTGSSTIVSIPDGIVAIGVRAFEKCYGLKEVSIPEGVVSIEEWAFASCRALERISFPNSLTKICGFAFYNCVNLPEINLPNSLTMLQGAAFSGCVGLKKASMPDSERINVICGDTAFEGCCNLHNIHLPDKSWFNALEGTAYMYDYNRRLDAQKKALENQRRAKGLCVRCGGNFKGFFEMKCTKCGSRKDY